MAQINRAQPRRYPQFDLLMAAPPYGGWVSINAWWLGVGHLSAVYYVPAESTGSFLMFCSPG